MLTAQQKLEQLELISEKLENLADECYDMGFTALGNTLIEQGSAIAAEMQLLVEEAV